MKEVGLPGPLNPAPRPVGVGPEEELGTAPLPTYLNAALVTAPPLKRVGKKVVTVSAGIPHLIILLCALLPFYFMDLHFRVNC